MEVCKCASVQVCCSVQVCKCAASRMEMCCAGSHYKQPPLATRLELWVEKQCAAVKVELSIVVEKFTGKLPIKPRVTIKLLAASAWNEPFTTFTTAVKTAPVARQLLDNTTLQGRRQHLKEGHLTLDKIHNSCWNLIKQQLIVLKNAVLDIYQRCLYQILSTSGKYCWFVLVKPCQDSIKWWTTPTSWS